MKYFLALAAVIVSLVLVTFAYIGESGKPHQEALEGEYQQISQKIEALKVENDKLKNQIEALKNDQSTIERAAREQLGMVKKNEIILQFFDALGKLDNRFDL